MALSNEVQKRLVAYKVSVDILLQGEFVKGEGWESSHITLADLKIGRINIMGVVIDISIVDDAKQGSILLDDGNGQIQCRFFETTPLLGKLVLGDCVNIIGRPREYQAERYVVVEIVRKIDAAWMQVRKNDILKFEQHPQFTKFDRQPEYEQIKKDGDTNVTSEIIDEIIKPVQAQTVQHSLQNVQRPTDRVIALLRLMDDGKGVDQDELLKHANLKNGEDVIYHLLKEGEIFEMSPGKLKVLE